jgi:galactokinase/mevalonate kinase-like predicted kinase
MPLSVRKILENDPVEASAPCRIDAGGTWDIKAMALPFEAIRPVTVNMALDLRTRVNLFPFEDGKIKISSHGFSREEVFATDRLPLDSPFGLFFAAVSHFGFQGLELRIRSESPVKSALGGSSTALVALVKALDKINTLLGQEERSRRHILHLAYHLEDAVAGGNCGIQDQGAATYGGVNLWTWHFGNPVSSFERTVLLEDKDLETLSKHVIVAYSGESHVSSTTNRKWLKEFLSGKTREGWLRVNELVRTFARKIQAREWSEAAHTLQEEMSLRRKITPEALIPISDTLIQQAEQRGCGARFAGAGAGGAVWAIGELEDIRRARETWEKTLDLIEGARMLSCRIDQTGAVSQFKTL